MMAKAAAAAAAASGDGGGGDEPPSTLRVSGGGDAGPPPAVLAELTLDPALESDPEEATTPVEHSDPVTPLPRNDPGIEPIPLVSNLSDDNVDAMISNRSTSPFRWGDVTDTDTGSALGDSMPDMSSPLLCASPGGSVLLHQKLSSPSRKRSISEYGNLHIAHCLFIVFDRF